LLDSATNANCRDDLTTFMLNMQDIHSGSKVHNMSTDMSEQSELPVLLHDAYVETMWMIVFSVMIQ